MKVELNNTPATKELTYPCLKVSGDGMVMLFTEPDTGLILEAKPETGFSAFQFADDWKESNFKPYYGSITLQND